MAALTLAQTRALARLYVQDQDSVDPGISDADWNSLINQAGHDFAAAQPQALVEDVGTVSLSGSLKFATYINSSGLDIRYLLRAEVNAGTAGARGNELELMSVSKVRRLQQSVGASGTPTIWAHQINGPSDNSWKIFPYPVPTGATTLRLWAAIYPTDLTTDADSFPYGAAESRWIAMVAAARGAGILRRSPDFVRNIVDLLPQQYQMMVQKRRGDTRPQPDIEKEQA